METGASREPETAEVLPQHKFDCRSLEAYLHQHLPGFGAEPEAKLTVAQYRSGQSNPTFYLQKGFQAYVLRKKPPGSLLPKAHKIDREFKVQKTLFSIGFPVPKPLLYCSDACVIGTEFYVMEHVQGRIFRDFTIPEVSPAERSAIYVAMIETLAQLHSLNIQSLQLEEYGRGAGYCKRQVSTWTKQYQAAAHQDIPAMNQLSDWLMKNLPDNDNEENLIHGDFKLDNIVFHPKESRVVAVLDWELSTIGHPLSDLAHLSMFYFWPRTIPLLSQSPHLQENIGVPSMEELISIYCRCRGINSNLPNWNFFLALSYFKIAGIAQGVYSRYLLGNNASESSFQFANIVQPLAETGLQLSKRTFSTALPQTDTTRQLFVQTRTGHEVLTRVKQFMKQHILPAEKEVIEFYVQNENAVDKWKKPLVIDKLKEMAKAEGLWNLFLPAVSGLSQVDYALIAEETGKCFFAPDVFNCQAPDTGNMEVLHLYGSEKQKQQWLEPLLQGSIASCFCMTEPDVASSDATNIECSIQQDGDSYIINGKKWWCTGAGNPKCKIAIVMGKSNNNCVTRHKQHSMILVPINTPGVEVIRPLSVFGYLDSFHGGHFEIHFNQVRVPATNLILGEGRGFEIAQGRLGPGRIHHCMRTIGLAERALQIMCERAKQRVAFKKKLYSHEVVAHWIAESRIAIEEIRLLTLKAAHSIDTLGSSGAKKEIAMIKVAAPRAVCKIIDQAIQVCGGAGVSHEYPLANMYALTRTLRLADGPDEVHLSAVAKMELWDQARSLRAKV
ncbi:acyl-CoA dehydrogenase family member 11 isoform X1 [Sagmatias obliquidens]|uniref:acyl-CoA dehydrogenase family member 11 isoform X1 n=2 Tax=Sagmatias obliquidens TaxID=3371155 RepID=UPI000F43EA88|nr:acyl-CoA dehydrogenase family member 11 isoform X1 [Lagenorhynchus obliquidens]XP_026947471.1 acyl-CoA dehydrogenase family member 11 isoform X1 [Lagenorhynchus obliquidens]